MNKLMENMSAPVTAVARPPENKCEFHETNANTFYLYMFAITPTSIMGIVLNAIILIVLGKQQKNAVATSVFLLRILAGCDIFFLLCCLVFFFIRHMVVYFEHRTAIFTRGDNYIGGDIFYWSIPWYFAALQSRNGLIVLITLERFLNIVFPLWARPYCTEKNFGKAAIGIILLSLSCNMPTYWFLEQINVSNPCTGNPEVQIRARPGSRRRTYDSYLYLLGMVVVPLSLVYVMNVVLIISLRKAIRRRSKMTGGETGKDQEEKANRQATLMVVSILIVFTLCETPATVDRLAGLAGLQLFPDRRYHDYFRKFGLLLIVVDSAMNFVAYCITNRTFRQNFLSVFRKKIN
ncbi:FMRFamide receptor-like [Lineus longissimus]|uniref:FMRFamide receptor-like n=1 Tax=Lineus longissimus TaxID=88925 RepID=UPI00315D1B3E